MCYLKQNYFFLLLLEKILFVKIVHASPPRLNGQSVLSSYTFCKADNPNKLTNERINLNSRFDQNLEIIF